MWSLERGGWGGDNMMMANAAWSVGTYPVRERNEEMVALTCEQVVEAGFLGAIAEM